MHIEGGAAQMLSIPRDLYVPIAGTDESQKINAAYNEGLGGGPQMLVDTITQSLGIPIDRYMEVDFVSFAGLVDALGGVTIDFPHPAQDERLGPVPARGRAGRARRRAGPGVRALAPLPRDRQRREQVEDPRGDLGRILRQQKFLTAVFGKLSDSQNPFTLLSAASNMAEGLRIDDEMSMFDAMRFALGPAGRAARGARARHDPGPQRVRRGADPRRGGVAGVARRGALSPGEAGHEPAAGGAALRRTGRSG